MADTADLERRLIALESHVAHLEASNAEMSEMIARQWEQIDKLVRTVKGMHERLQDVEPAPETRKPPHY